MREVRVPVNSHIPLRPNERCSPPITAFPLQSIEKPNWLYFPVARKERDSYGVV